MAIGDPKRETRVKTHQSPSAPSLVVTMDEDIALQEKKALVETQESETNPDLNKNSIYGITVSLFIRPRTGTSSILG